MQLNAVYRNSALDFLKGLPNDAIDLIYTDPPFGTGDMQTMNRKKAGKTASKIEYRDKHDNYLEFLEPHQIGRAHV